MEIIPIYKSNNRILVTLKSDLKKLKRNDIIDSLVVEIDLESGQVMGEPWSGQKKLKFGHFEHIEPNYLEKIKSLLIEKLGFNKISEIKESLNNPSEKSINSLLI